MRIRYEAKLALTVLFEAKDSGIAPALNIKIHTGLQPKKLPIEHIDLNKIISDALAAEPNIFPGEEPFTFLDKEDFSAEDMAHLRSPEYGLLACAVVDYDDVFDKPHSTSLCALAEGDQIDKNFPNKGENPLVALRWHHVWNEAN